MKWMPAVCCVPLLCGACKTHELQPYLQLHRAESTSVPRGFDGFSVDSDGWAVEAGVALVPVRRVVEFEPLTALAMGFKAPVREAAPAAHAEESLLDSTADFARETGLTGRDVAWLIGLSLIGVMVLVGMGKLKIPFLSRATKN